MREEMSSAYERLKKKKEKVGRRKLILFFVLFSLVFYLFGGLDFVYGLIFEPLKESSQEYLSNSIHKSKNLVISLSVIIGILDVIEGSGLNMVVDLELGDIVQPILEISRIMWKMSLVGATTLTVERLAIDLLTLDIIKRSFLVLVSASLVYLFIPREFFKKVLNAVWVIFLLIFIFFPVGINISSRVTNGLTTYKEKIELTVKSLEKESKLIKEDLEENQKKISMFNLKKKSNQIKEGFINNIKKIENRTDELYENSIILIAIILIDSVLLPLILLMLIYYFIKISILSN